MSCGNWGFNLFGQLWSLIVRKNSGTEFASRRRLNLVEGTGISLTVTDVPVQNEVRATIAISTPVSVASGGTGTSTVFTTGSVIFVGASGVYTQDNADLFWDNTNKRLGVGQQPVQGSLDVFSLAQVSGVQNPGLYWTTNSGNAAARNWGVRTNHLAFGDWVVLQSTTNANAPSASQLYLDATGQLGVGTSVPANKVHLAGGKFYCAGTGITTGITFDNWLVYQGSDATYRIDYNGTDMVAIDTSGHMCLGGSLLPASLLDLFGGTLTLSAATSTSKRTQADLVPSWVDSTDATRKARLIFDAYDTAARECIRIEATGTAAAVGFLGAGASVRQTSGANLTNNVTSGGTTDQIDDFTSLTVYATDAAAIRNDIYQLARKVKQVNDALRLYGLLT